MIDTLYNYLMMSIENNLKVDENYLRNLLNFFVRYYHLTNYIKSLEIIYEPYKKNLLAEYEFAKIKINLRVIKENLDDTFNEIGYFKKFTPYERKLFSYTYFIEIIAHEVYHALELRNIYSTKDNIEKQILYPIRWTLPVRENIPNYNKLYSIYKRYYGVCPTERFAYFYSLNLCYQLLNTIPKSDIVRNEYLIKLLSYLLNTYNISLEPTKFFLEKAYAIYIWPKLEEKIPKLSLERKLIYGFDIPNSYYHKLINEMIDLEMK